MRIRLATFASLVATVALALPGAAAAGTADYVSLGDSYVAGPFIPPPIPPWGCLKSANNYAHLTATRVGVTLADPSCSGAETEDMTASQGVSPEPNPPQFDSLQPDTQKVTLSIGGNDIGFSSLAEDCFSTTPNAGSPCHDRYVVNGDDQISDRIAATGPKVASVIQGIHSRSPNARVFVVTYPAIFPDSGPGCWPVLPVSDGDVPWLRGIQKELNQMLADQAAANGATLIDWYTASIGHDACQPPGVKWTEAAVPMTGVAPVHPNLLGMVAASNLVVTAFQG